MKPATHESEIETMLKNLPPEISPRLEKSLLTAPWTPRAVRRRRALTIIYLTGIFLIAFIGLTPQGRAFAQSIIKFFTTTGQSFFPLSKEELDSFYTPYPPRALSLVDVTPVPPLPEYCSSPEDVGTYECEIQQVEKELSINLKEFSATPMGSFQEIRFYSRSSTGNTESIVGITYGTSGAFLSLIQGEGEFPPDSDWEKVPLSAVQPVKIGEYDGACIC